MARTFLARSLLGLLIAAGVAFSGLGRLTPLERFEPPEVPRAWAPLPSEGRVQMTLVGSEGLVSGIAAGLSSAEVALQRGGAVALVDGRVFASSGSSARRVLRTLSWDALPIDARQMSVAELERFAAPTPASPAWRARKHTYLALRSARDLLAAHPDFGVTAVAAALVLLLLPLIQGLPRRWSGVLPTRPSDEGAPPPSPWRLRRAENPVRVVLVQDAQTLAQVRVAIGEEHVVAATEHAFAFADGWILAVHKGSVFELVGELGWRMRPIEMATRSELVGEGHAVSPLPGDDAADTLGLLEALHVCGPVAHGTVPHIATAALSQA